MSTHSLATLATARDIMARDIRGVRSNSLLGEVVELLGHHDCTGLPVVDENNRLVGVVTEFDCLPAVSDPELLYAPVSEHMSSPNISVNEDATVGEISLLFQQERIRRAPVLRDGSVVGIVSRKDLIKFIRNHHM